MQKLPLFNKQVSLVGKRLSDIYNFEPVCSGSSLLIPCWDECTINVVVLINGEEWIKILEIRVKQKSQGGSSQRAMRNSENRGSFSNLNNGISLARVLRQ